MDNELAMITSDVTDYGDDLVKPKDHPDFPEIPNIKYHDSEKSIWKRYNSDEIKSWKPKNKAWKYDKIKEWERIAEPKSSKEWKYKEIKKTKPDINPDSKLDGIDLPYQKREGNRKEWSYRRIRDLIALLHIGLFEYADRLSSYIAYSSEFKGKLVKCEKRLSVLTHDLKNLVQDKIKLQELLKDLSAKYNMLEHALKKAGDINQDNKDTIEKIRVNRDKCIQTIDNRNEVVTSLRNQNSELRRHLASLRSRFGK